jgi:hypothetical protein
VRILRATRLDPSDGAVIDTFVKMAGVDTRTVTVNSSTYFLYYEVVAD